MAMIQCPDCGKDVSDKAKKCIHCGKVLIEEVVPKKFCSDCGKEVPIYAEECPFCGCPIEPDKPVNPVVLQITEKAKNNQKSLKKIGIVAAVVIILGIIIAFAGSTLNEDEQLAYQNAVEMKSMMKDPDSFKLYDEMFLLKHFDESGNNDYTYTVFKYGGANGYGAITTDEAIFKDGEFLMNYADDVDYDSPNYSDQLYAKLDISSYFLFGDDETMKMVEIDIEKIKDKMGLE